jgi:hypothetical protein
MFPFGVEAVSECRRCLLQYGDILREGWRNLVECLLCKMFPFGVEAVSECRRCLLQYGDILREGWRNLVECLLQMFRVQLLPTSMMEAEDYIESSGRCGVKNFFNTVC